MPTEHPVIEAARRYAEERTPKEHNPPTYVKSYAVWRDGYLLAAATGILQLIKEIESNPKAETPYDLDEAYALLLLLRKHVVGISGSFNYFFIRSGIVSSDAEIEFYLAKARLDAERNQRESEPLNPIPMIGVVGAISSGKGTIGKLAQKKCNSIHLPLSDRLREVSLAQGGASTFPRDELRQINDTLKPVFGMDVFVRWTIDIAQKQANIAKAPLVTIDGFRSVKESETFKNNGGILIGIKATQETRYKRLQQRDRKGDDNWQEFLKSDAIESEWINPIFSLCDYIVYNDGTEQELEAQVDQVFERLGII